MNSYDVLQPFLYTEGIYDVALIGPIFGKGLFFCNVMYASYTATLIASIHYAGPVISLCMRWGADMSKVMVAVLLFFAINFITAEYMDSWFGNPGNAASFKNGWWGLFFVQGAGVKSTPYVKQWSSCGEGQFFCLSGDFIQQYWVQYLWTLFIWPVIVCCKIIMIKRVPIHLASIGSTTFGAYMIHAYCPVPVTHDVAAFIENAVGSIMQPYILFVYITAYILLLQYTLGRLVNYITMAGVTWFIQKCEQIYVILYGWGIASMGYELINDVSVDGIELADNHDIQVQTQTSINEQTGSTKGLWNASSYHA